MIINKPVKSSLGENAMKVHFKLTKWSSLLMEGGSVLIVSGIFCPESQIETGPSFELFLTDF